MKNRKGCVVFLLCSLAIAPVFAQKTVKMSAVKANDYGVAYKLPKTEIKVKVKGTEVKRERGEYYQYAERYLNVSNPIIQDETSFVLDKIEIETIGVVDKEKSYLVEFKSNTVAPYVSLTEDGLICAINEGVKIVNDEAAPKKNEEIIKNTVNPKTILSEEVLRAGSVAKQAELIAKQIYLLRESRTNILTGEADNMPPDGAAYQLVMTQLDDNEKALTSLFIGRESQASFEKEFTVAVERKNIDKQVVFRFSSHLGVVGANDLSGEPVYLSLKSKTPLINEILTPKEEKALEKKFSSGIIYNIPGKADLKIDFKNNTMVKQECDIVQFGSQEVLVKEMFDNKKQPIKVLFHPFLGAIKQIIE